MKRYIGIAVVLLGGGIKLLAWMMLQSHGKDLNNWKTFLSDLEQE